MDCQKQAVIGDPKGIKKAIMAKGVGWGVFSEIV